MKRALRWLFTLQGTVGPLPYLISGVLAFALKYLLDGRFAALLAHRSWRPWQYLDPMGTSFSLLTIAPAERRFFLVVTAVAVPFIWFGIALTIRRVRARPMSRAMS